MKCSKCGNELKEGAKFCGHCGYKVEQNDEYSKEELKTSPKKDNKFKIFIIIILAILVISGIVIGTKVFKEKQNTNEIHENETEIESSNIGKTVEDLGKEIRMYEWEEIYPTEEERKELSGAEWNLKYEYILYDNKGRELVNIPGEKRTENYYKYTEIDEYSYYKSRLYLNPFLEEMYHEELSLIYLDENYNIVNEELVSDISKTREEYVGLLEEHNGYIEYIDKNKSYRNNLDEYRRIFEK